MGKILSVDISFVFYQNKKIPYYHNKIIITNNNKETKKTDAMGWT